MLDEDWIHFTQTGNINYYLKYKQNENLRAENNAKNNEGLSDTGADYRGE